MYLKRKVDRFLSDWKSDQSRLPLIIRGARQVGKTKAIRQFAKNNYKNLAVVDESTPIFIIAGTMDPVGDYTKSVKKLIKVYKHHWLNVYFKFYEGARHELLNETNKEEVIKDIVEFLGADNKKANMR